MCIQLGMSHDIDPIASLFQTKVCAPDPYNICQFTTNTTG